MVRRVGLFALLLVGCGEEWSPESLVEDLRVIGMRAEPAEIKPGETAALSALMLDPSRPGKLNTVLWLGCDPDPFNLGRSACSDPTALQDPSAFAGGAQLPMGVHVIGLNNNAAFSADKNLFRALEQADPRRMSGTVGQVLSIAVAEESPLAPTAEETAALFERVKNKEVKSVISLFRIRISEAPERNHNPKISRFLVAGEPQFPGARTQLFPGEQVTVEVQAPDCAGQDAGCQSSFEPYVEQTPTGDEARIERINSSWYSTAGRFSVNRVALGSEVKAVFTAPGSAEFPKDPVPERRTGSFLFVLRDSRGGQDWAQAPFFVCDSALPAPAVSAVRSPAARGSPVGVEGKELASLLDVVVGGIALEKGSVNPLTGNWEALVPASLAAGTYPVRVHGKDCSRVDTAFTLTVP
jgi:hypothetical protein